MTNAVELVPEYWASVSGGKDSLYMLKLILDNPQRYPLDGVVHFELEIDFPFIHDVVNLMASMCKTRGIPFIAITPRISWYELYEKYGFPDRKARWCNSSYKLDAQRQLSEMLRQRGKRVVSYIGYCSDETKRFNKRVGLDEIYPLVDFGVDESFILSWAQNQPIFNDFYKYNRRCGCMFCPLSSRITMAYIALYYPESWEKMLCMIKETEISQSSKLGRPFAVIDKNPKYDADYLRKIIPEKWIPRLLRLSEEVYNNYE